MEKVENQEVEQVEEATEEFAQVLHEHSEVLERRQEIIDDINVTLDEINKNQDAIEKREQELFQKEVAFTLKEHGLELFADVVTVKDAEALSDVVEKLTAIVNDIKVSAGYVPKDNAKQDSYTIAKEEGNTRNMIKALFGKR